MLNWIKKLVLWLELYLGMHR